MMARSCPAESASWRRQRPHEFFPPIADLTEGHVVVVEHVVDGRSFQRCQHRHAHQFEIAAKTHLCEQHSRVGDHNSPGGMAEPLWPGVLGFEQ